MKSVKGVSGVNIKKFTIRQTPDDAVRELMTEIERFENRETEP